MDADNNNLGPDEPIAGVHDPAELEAERLDAHCDVGTGDGAECEDAALPAGHSLIDVLFPAAPPAVPRHARVIRRFDLEAAQHDPRPVAEAPAPEQKEPAPSREEVRALRNRSLRAAAGFF